MATALSVVALFALVRLFSLDADPPERLTWSVSLYTDEGLWSRNAVWAERGDHWYCPGDYNPAVMAPVAFVLQSMTFGVAGVGLTQARGLVAVLSVALILLVISYLWRTRGILCGLLAGGLLATNFLFFAYSRLALLEIPMALFATLAVFAALGGRSGKPGYSSAIIAGVFLLVAATTKFTAVAVAPAALVAIWTGPGSVRSRLLRGAVMLAVFGAGMLGHQWWVNAEFPVDGEMFRALNMNALEDASLPAVLHSCWSAFSAGTAIDGALFPLAIALLLLAALPARKLPARREILVLGTWLVLFLAAFGFRGYVPPRYYASLVVPVTMMVAIVLDQALRSEQTRLAARVLAALVLVAVLLNAARIGRVVISPDHTYMEFARQVEKRLLKDGARQPVFVGIGADTVALVTGARGITLKEGGWTLPDRLAHYGPTYMVSIGEPNPELIDPVRSRFLVEPPIIYDVLGNYSLGRPILVSRLRPLEPAQEAR